MMREERKTILWLCLSLLAVGLVLAELVAGLRPGEVEDWNLEEGVVSVHKTSQSVVPCHKGSEEAKETSSLLKVGLSNVVAKIVGVVLSRKQEEANVEEEEEGEEGDGRSKCADKEDGGEDPPASEEETHDGTSVTLIRAFGT